MQKKSSFSLITLAACIMISFFSIWGCSKTSDGPTSSNNTYTTINKLINMATNLTLYQSALAKTGLDTTLNGSGPFTVFIPNDASFAASGITSTTIDTLSDSAVYQILTYNIIAGQGLLASSFPSGPDAPIITSGGDSIFVTNNLGGFFVNGIPIGPVDVIASNGIIDAVSLLPLPPKGTILQIIQTDSLFSYCAAALSRASQGTTNLDSILTGDPYTVFVPLNSAFQNAGYATINDINNAVPDTLARILAYHILPKRQFTSDLVQVSSVLTLNANALTVNPITSSTVSVKGNSNGSPSDIIQGNIMAHNGVIHSIDQLLLP